MNAISTTKHLRILFLTALMVIPAIGLNAQSTDTDPSGLEVSLFTNPYDWHRNIANMGIQFQSTKGWTQFFSVVGSGIFSSETATLEQAIQRYTSTTAINGKIRVFPYGQRRDFKAVEEYGCQYVFSPATEQSNTSRHVLGGVFIGAGYGVSWNKAVYELPPGLPSPRSTYKNDLEIRSILLDLGYQLKLWHFHLGAYYEIGLQSSKWRSNGGPDVFNTPPIKQFSQRLNFEVGLRF